METDDKLVDEHRFDILNAVREGILSEKAEFRGAMWKCTLATHAVVVALVSLLFTKGVTMGTSQKILLSFGVVTFVFTCGLVITALKRHFIDHAVVLNRINRIFGVFTPGAFVPDESLYLTKWSWTGFGEKGFREPLFRSAYISLGIVCVFAIAAVWIGA